ncbi:MAG: tRNA preQ1(34) S-adenosylmethionine ribosyltransferase-isomerase QueA [Pseudomonadota bacterium]
MRVDDFDFELPDENIALRPAEPRDAARLLLVDGDRPLTSYTAADLPKLLRAGDALVFNDTRVLPAQLTATRTRDDSVATLGVTLHLREAPDTWRAFVRGAKRLNVGETVTLGEGFTAVASKRLGGEVTFTFDRGGNDLDAALARHGVVPLPPYIAGKRAIDDRDADDYQTIYADEAGAVAAPTAGLHFTKDLFAALDAAEIERHFVTLHVGAGTFLPVKVEDTADHVMHEEIGVISAKTAEALNAVRARGGRVVCVGTTSLRLLESAAASDGTLSEWSGATDIFITPGHEFRAVDGLMTNFHLPRSTLFMLVSAFCGRERMLSAYRYAIDEGYRFYSYGDTSLLWRSGNGG